MRSTRMLLSALAGVAIISCAESTGPSQQSLAPKGNEAVTSERGGAALLSNMKVEGALENGGTFAGFVTVTEFGFDEATRTLLVSGVISGWATNAAGERTHVKDVAFTDVPATLSREAAVASLDAEAGLIRPVAQASCDVLFLDLGPLHLDLLGLTVDLSQIVLDINAVTGAGNLLGNLLCGLLGILDGLGTLANILAILDQINNLLAGLGGLLGASA